MKDMMMENWRRFLLEVEQEDEEAEVEVVFDLGDEEDEEEGEDEDELEEWKSEDDYDYPSRKKERRLKRMLKPDRTSWVHAADALAKGGLAKGIYEKKKPRKPQCHAYNPFHDDDGKFAAPEKDKGSYSMEKPDKDSPDDCTWGQARRSSANRSTQSTKRPGGRKGKWRLKDGTAKWEEELIREVDEILNDDINQQDAAYLRGILSDELKKALAQQMQGGGCSFAQLVRAMTLWSQAEKGGGKEK